MRKGNSLSKSVMAARTRPIGTHAEEHNQDFESVVSNFMEKQAFKARVLSRIPLPTTIVLSDLEDGTSIYNGPAGRFFAEMLPDLPDDKWFDVVILNGTDVANHFHAGKDSLMALHAALIDFNRKQAADEAFVIRKR